VDRPIIGTSPALAEVLELVDRVAASDATVLLTGESGTGKELLARRIHVRSNRGAGPFVPVNAAAVPAELLESELFGHRAGAFTGAVRDRIGRFRQADGGTLFLDEIGDLPLPLQAKLLRVLQERMVEVVGADAPEEIDVRVVAATNRDVAAEVAAGRFREDLLYRLNVVEIRLPALRERIDDIGALVAHFVERFGGGRELAVPDDLLDELRGRAWPGNVRELENVVQRLVALSDDSELAVADLPPGAVGGRAAGGTGALLGQWPELPDDGLSLIDLEKSVIERVLELKGGNVTQAAAYLHVPRHVLAYRMEKYGIPRKR
jgi:two-component system NtrC family response regulator